MKLSCGCQVDHGVDIATGKRTIAIKPCKPNCMVLQFLMDEAKDLGQNVERIKPQ